MKGFIDRLTSPDTQNRTWTDRKRTPKTTMRFFNSTSDLGLGFKHFKGEKRIINKDGSFNVRREGRESFTRDLYQDLIKMSWSRFISLTLLVIFSINFLFAVIYVIIGSDGLNGLRSTHYLFQFLEVFYFSFQTFTTVGYGHISPSGQWISMVAAVEAVVGLLTFAIVTGLLYGRFSKPTALITYSEKALIAPYSDITSFQFRVANLRNSVIMELSAHVLMMSIVKEGDVLHRRFERLKLERDDIVFFPLNWTIVHPITEESPLYRLTPDQMKERETEFIILLKGYDDTFGDYVYSRYSYRWDEIVWNARFSPAFGPDEDGDLVLYMDKISDFEKVKS